MTIDKRGYVITNSIEDYVNTIEAELDRLRSENERLLKEINELKTHIKCHENSPYLI